MANTKITGLIEDTSPTSDDLLVTVNTPNTTPSNKKVTAANVITKAHGLSDGIVKVSSGTMAIASGGTDYANASHSHAASDITSGTINTARLGSGTANSGTFLRGDSSWVAVAGQAPWDAIVASSGGTHTTLGSAIGAASAGWRILVLDGTSETGNITSALAGLYICGAGANANTEVNLVPSGTGYTLTLSGANVTITNLTIRCSGNDAMLTFSGANQKFTNVRFELGSTYPSGGNDKVSNTGEGSIYDGCEFITTNTSTSGLSARLFALGGTGAVCTNSYFKSPCAGSNANQSVVYLSGLGTRFENNYMLINSAADDSYLINSGGNNCIVSGNTLNGGTSTKGIFMIYATGQYSVVSNNSLKGGYYGITVFGQDINVVGNTCILNESAAAYGIRISSSNALVTGNYIYTTDASVAGYGVYISNNVDDSTVIGNKIRGFQYGLYIAGSGADRTVFKDNVFYNTTTTPITDSGTTSTIYNNVGTSIVDEKNHLWLKNTSGGALSAGQVVVLKAVAAGDEITTTTTAGDDKVVGVVSQSSISDNSYGFVQVLGKTTTLKANGTSDIAVGDFLTTYTSAGIAAKATTGDMVFAIALEAYTTDDSNGVIDALLISPRLI